ncbi:SPOR domain-containing protein [Pseudooceanicola marinus]|uniref:SPOR domain-containing protein n=1 Tax=Pseudooceanicola marinus TaxID=396013 RepID=UPI001CD30D16|nr:SPOR domain-containing protein [Pseudooceanicola marinus]MCA1334181.1 SPOR domain-containing protein [Pseudooceanicola marinus]
MADFPADGRYASYDEYPDAPGQPASFGGLVTWVGGALSLALIAGVGLWGYKMVMRDVSGVPVVRAMSGESRRVPDSAGGQEAEFQGLSVNHVAATQGAEGSAGTVRLAPAPMGLGDDAVTEAELEARARAEAEAAAPVSAPAPLDLSNPDRIQDLAAQLSQGADPLTAMQPKTVTPPETSAASEAESAARRPTGGVAVAVRPKTRPDELLANVAARQVAGPVSTPETVLDVAPEEVPLGTRMAQLGAFGSHDVAVQEWDKFAARFGIYMDGKQRVIQRAESGGRIFYRLRVLGFDDLSDSRRFCAALVAEGADCIPVSAK